MKKTYLLLLASLITVCALAQEQTQVPVKTGKNFFVGISYFYTSLDMKLQDMSIHTVWAGQDMGKYDLSEVEIDEINSFTERTATTNNVCAEVGMPLLNKAGSPWRIDGILSIGVAQIQKTTYNQNSGIEEYKHTSGFSNPFLGLGFNIAYQIDPIWGLELRPVFNATMGKDSEVTDNINLVPENFTQTFEDNYHTFYERVSLLGSFSAGSFRLFAGPGFYWINSKHQYNIEQTNINNGDLIQDEIISNGISRSFIDGNVALDWKITAPLSFYAHVAIGGDIFINSGIHYNF